MTVTASHALSLLIRADLREGNEQLQRCLKAIEESQCDLVGIVVCNEVAEVFIADFPRDIEQEIQRFEQRGNAFREFPDARWYLCRDGKATQCERSEFFGALWLRLIEVGKRQARNV